MQDLITLLNQLKTSGITPRVQITLPAQNPDAQQIIALNNELKSAGITPEVHINVHMTPGGEIPPVVEETPAAPEKEKGILVQIKVPKTNMFEFTRKDAAGKPIMEIHEPRIQLFSGTQVSVSATHKAGDKDTGDGVVLGTGGFRFYFVVDCPTNRSAEGLYLRQSDASKL